MNYDIELNSDMPNTKFRFSKANKKVYVEVFQDHSVNTLHECFLEKKDAIEIKNMLEEVYGL